ncbi:unnamed protein product [Zymoseptoria tritici ST99CH_3D1]|nr:unnamed protein product [Zymoseptoria tritici ST99CH_3D1]
MVIPVFYLEDPPSLHAIEPTGTASPLTRCGLTYLNEGGANFVFRIVHPPCTPIPPRLQNRLLRIRKDLPHIQSAESQLEAFYKHFHGLFPEEHLVQHELIMIDQSVLALLNTELQAMDRPSHRAQDFLPEEDLKALLMTDMTVCTDEGADEVLLQLKPKWLAQSPDAPGNAKRCRTCALRACRAGSNVRTATDRQGSCPLGLMSEVSEERRRAVESVTGDPAIREYLLGEVSQGLLRRLKHAQMSLDSGGVLSVGDDEQGSLNLCKAMTLRDCSLFVRRLKSTIEAKLGDLDLKQPEKIKKWKKVERDLIDGGWYTNTEQKRFWMQEEDFGTGSFFMIVRAMSTIKVLLR